MGWQAEEDIDDTVAIRPRRRAPPQNRDDGDEESYDAQCTFLSIFFNCNNNR